MQGKIKIKVNVMKLKFSHIINVHYKFIETFTSQRLSKRLRTNYDTL